MKAVTCREYGDPHDVLRLEDVEMPVVGDDEVLVRVHASSINPADWHLVTGRPHLVRLMRGLRRPRDPRIGLDLAGTVEAIGREVTGFELGEEVYGEAGGGYGEYSAAKERHLAPRPASVSFAEAAAVPVAGLTAIQGLRDHARLEEGQHVLVHGASGGVGTFVVQIAKAWGAVVTGVCSTRNVEMVQSIGADRVIDHTTDDFVEGGERFDAFIDCASVRSVSDCLRVVKPGGVYVAVSGGEKSGDWFGPIVRMARLTAARVAGKKQIRMFTARADRPDLDALRDLVERGAVTPVIGGRHALSDVAEALARQGANHAPGKTVIEVIAD